MRRMESPIEVAFDCCYQMQCFFLLSVLALASVSSFTSISSPVSRNRESSLIWGINTPASRFRSVQTLRGGATAPCFSSILSAWTTTPSGLFNVVLAALGVTAIGYKALEAKVADRSKATGDDKEAKPRGVKSLQARFLIVFWLMRMADWLQGPYFYEVYSSKILNGAPVSLDLVSKLFLVGFASTGIFGPWIGRLVDSVGRKCGTIMFAVLYTVGALSTRSSLLPLLLLGRVAGGLGTSLLFSAPEAWLISEHTKAKYDSKWLGQTFGYAYAGDAIVAIAAGQLASAANSFEGPTGPFTLSVGFLAMGSLIAALKWGENTSQRSRSGEESDSTPQQEKKPSIGDAIDLMRKDNRILLLGAVQAFFEGAMYIFVLQWPPAMKAAIQSSVYGAGAAVPFGGIFSCFMASCLLGSTVFGSMQSRKIQTEVSMASMLALATTAISVATVMGQQNLAILTASFFLFEACVGFYFPSIGTLRSKYLPDSHRSVIMNLFGIPLNLIVVSVFLSIKFLGVTGALTCSSVALGVATVCMTILNRMKK